MLYLFSFTSNHTGGDSPFTRFKYKLELSSTLISLLHTSKPKYVCQIHKSLDETVCSMIGGSFWCSLWYSPTQAVRKFFQVVHAINVSKHLRKSPSSIFSSYPTNVSNCWLPKILLKKYIIPLLKFFSNIPMHSIHHPQAFINNIACNIICKQSDCIRNLLRWWKPELIVASLNWKFKTHWFVKFSQF